MQQRDSARGQSVDTDTEFITAGNGPLDSGLVRGHYSLLAFMGPHGATTYWQASILLWQNTDSAETITTVCIIPQWNAEMPNSDKNDSLSFPVMPIL